MVCFKLYSLLRFSSQRAADSELEDSSWRMAWQLEVLRPLCRRMERFSIVSRDTLSIIAATNLTRRRENDKCQCRVCRCADPLYGFLKQQLFWTLHTKPTPADTKPTLHKYKLRLLDNL